jgi:hypothetical protein
VLTKINAFYVYGHFCSVSEETEGSKDSGHNNKWSSANMSVGSLTASRARCSQRQLITSKSLGKKAGNE